MATKKLLKRATTTIIAPALAVALSAASAHTYSFDLNNQLSSDLLDLSNLSKAGTIRANRFLVKYKENTSPNLINSTLANFQIESVSKLFKGYSNLGLTSANLSKWHIVDFSKGQNLQSAFAQLINDPNIESVTPDFQLETNLTSNDLGDQLWGLNNTGQTAQKQSYNTDTERYSSHYEAGTPGADINAVNGWDIKTDSSDVVVAVIDTGIDYNHDDLRNNMWVNTAEIAGNGIDDDNNGYIDDVYGYNFVSDTSDPMDYFGHGTHCAGTIAAEGNNGIGITGVSWNARLMAIKVLNDEGKGYVSDIAEGIIYATNMGAKVSNNSYGAFMENKELYGIAVYSPVIDAFKAANEAGMVAVTSAGNSRANLDDTANTYGELTAAYPSGINLSNIISVAATDADDQLAPFSNYGFADVDMGAPGVGILSTIPGNEYGLKSGTSMAAPHVSGAAALLIAQNPDLKPYEVRAILMKSGDSIAALEDITISGKRLNLAAALEYISDEPSECDSFSTSLSTHKTAGRAYTETETSGGTCWGTFCWGQTTTTTYYAQGSDEELGNLASTTVTLIETAPGYYTTQGVCAGGSDLPPVIEIVGEINDYILVGSTYEDAGAVATDREDGDISTNITISGYVDTNTVGNYPLTYEVTDSAGNQAVKITRFVNVRDNDGAPHIYLVPVDEKLGTDSFAKITKGAQWIEPGYYAWDMIDGDLTSQINAPSLDTNNDGFTALKYTVTDSQGNTTTEYRNVAVLDQNKPFIMSSKTPMNRNTFTSADLVEYTEDMQDYDENENCTYYNITSMPVDQADGVNGTITSTGEVNLCEAGVYDINLSFTDTDGFTDTQTIRVTVIGEPGSDLTCATANNTDHIAAGRATLKYNVLVYANGSNDYLGMSSDTTSLEETSAGNWTKVTSCQ